MQTTILDYDPALRSVTVRFAAGAIVHERAVNACHDEDGAYDEAATAARVADVARGVAQKIEVGAIVNPPAIELPAPLEPEPDAG